MVRTVNKRKAFRWAKALDSGKYPQGLHELKSKDGEYCCLGVLCEISKLKTTWIGNNVPSIFQLGDLDLATSQGFLPFKDRNGNTVSLVALNDDGLNFPQIADVIRHFYKEL